MSVRNLSLLFAGVLALVLIGTAPLALALRLAGAEARGLSAARVSGSVWNGRLEDASFQGAPLGEVQLGLDPAGLVMGGGRFRFVLEGPVSGRGLAQLRGARLGFPQLDLSGPTSAFAPGLPFAARVRLEGVEAQFHDGACRRAGGRVLLDEIALGRGAPLPGLQLSGPVACRAGAWTADLAGQAAGVNVEADVRIDGAGRYRLVTQVRTTDPTIEAALGLSGFERTLDGFRRTDHGQTGMRPTPIGP